ncbi:hypothetical protein Nepgr_026698 [Nepenthes gracilis]|uniref:Uncharacterized protein n=1 Tax=Nepenthes gracilis TaxID=150966 RepID=A0AAD3Y299_NEPGR|nr:hypothetical protein Nepgr_026698 [Nepenthes gracilis]
MKVGGRRGGQNLRMEKALHDGENRAQRSNCISQNPHQIHGQRVVYSNPLITQGRDDRDEPEGPRADGRGGKSLGLKELVPSLSTAEGRTASRSGRNKVG